MSYTISDSSFWYTPLTLTADSNSSTVQLTAVGNPTINGLQYRSDSTAQWDTYIVGTTIILSEKGSYVQFQNTQQTLSLSVSNNYVQFVMTGNIKASGNIQSLLNYREDVPTCCFFKLFYNCKALTESPAVLPAKTALGDSNYRYMFYGTDITAPPQILLQNTTAGTWSHLYSTFSYCKKLLYAPKIRLKRMENSSCYQMCRHCEALVWSPRISYSHYGYTAIHGLFAYCYNLVRAPEITGQTADKTLALGYVLSSCTNLHQVTFNFQQWPVDTAMTNWLGDTTNYGTFYKSKKLPSQTGPTKVPSNFTVINKDQVDCNPSLPSSLSPFGSLQVHYNQPLTLTAKQANSTVKITITGNIDAALYYRTDRDALWQPYVAQTVVNLSSVGDYVQFMNSSDTFSKDTSNYAQFVMTGNIAASGNVMSLANYAEDVPAYCFFRLFYNCKALTQAHQLQLPGRKLKGSSYRRMFSLTKIVRAPVCSFTQVQGWDNCTGLFSDCTALTDPPPDFFPQTLSQTTFWETFFNCTNLQYPPRMHAKSAHYWSLRSMFGNCSKLLCSPRLQNITTTNLRPFAGIFGNCKALTLIQVDWTSWPVTGTEPLSNWCSGVAPVGVFVKPSQLPIQYGSDRIPEGWHVVNKD